MRRSPALRAAFMRSASIPSYALGPLDLDRILNGAAHALWPILAPLVNDMLMRRR